MLRVSFSKVLRSLTTSVLGSLTIPIAAFLCCLTPALASAQDAAPGNGWAAYGGDLAGTRFSSSTQITRDNLQHLHPVWTFHTHALDKPRSGSDDASFEATPILSGDILYLTSPFDVVFALNARTGEKRWSFDPKVGELAADGIAASRGVALWESPRLLPGQCSRRLIFGTLDARLLAIDADTGTPCSNFGNSGEINLKKDVYSHGHSFYEVTSAPTIIGDIVVVGSSVGDNQQVDSESGLVRAFDVITGVQLWSWEPLPWAIQNHPRTGSGNTWSTISADPALGLVYLPTGSASPDYWGGLRPGDNRDADSIVALDARTGKKVWAFQVVHHDLWDYDVPSQPLLFTFHPNTPEATPAIAVSTKMDQVFVFDRRNGHPLYPIEERPVPHSDVPGEVTSPTQPFSSLPPVASLTLPLSDTPLWHRSLWNRIVCRVKLSGLRYEGIYTPPSLGGTIIYPGNLGGVNWGSTAFDPATGILYANNNRAAFTARLVPRNGIYMKWHDIWEPAIRDWPLWIYTAIGILGLNIIDHLDQRRRRSQPIAARDWLPSLRALIWAMIVAAIAAPMCIFPRPMNLSHFGHELSPQRETPYRILRDPLVDSDKRPCIDPPWGALTALNLDTGKIAWESPLGSMVPGERTGVITFGGPIVTASGLVFTAATEDPYIRAFDAASGAQLWQSELPAPAQATPMTYTLDGRQYVVIAAGGHADQAKIRGDSLIAFALDDNSAKK